MNILVACKYGQGARDNDFNWCTPGELVTTSGSQCDSDECIDGPCGCRRSFKGLDSNKATTTCLVEVDPNLTIKELARKVYENTLNGGWLGDNPSLGDLVEAVNESIIVALETAELAAHFTPGDVLERRGDEVCLRGGVPAIRAKYKTAEQPKETTDANTRVNSTEKRPANKRKPATRKPVGKSKRKATGNRRSAKR